MTGKVEDRGLCSTCDNGPRCAFKATRKKPAWHCEEFRCDGTSPVKNAGTPPYGGSPSIQSRAIKVEDSTQFIGLCSDCEDRESCVFPKPEGGIWHCEEYR